MDLKNTASDFPEPSLNQRILIIDDNRSIHDDVRKILGGPTKADDFDQEAADLFGTEVETVATVEFEIDSAYQGQEGLAMVQQALDEGRPYAMAFVDVRMPPGWDGIETIGHIWKLYPELQVVICTAYSDYSWEEMIRHLGKTDSLVILKKPFDNVEVLQLAHTLTQKWFLRHQLQAHLESLDRTVARRTAELQSANERLRTEMDERALAQRELVRSEERFSKAFQASPIPMAIQSLSGQLFLDVNDAFVAMTGYSRLQVIGKTAHAISLYENAEAEGEVLAQLVVEGSVRNFTYRLRTQAGYVRDCVMSAELCDFGSDKVALLASMDMSEQRRLENQLRHAQKLEAVGQLAAGVAHDFNNILTVIQSHATMRLAAANLEKDMSDSLKQVSIAAERAGSLTRQLLAFSRKQVVQPRPLNLNQTIGNLQDMLHRLIGEHIRMQFSPGKEVGEVFGDEASLEQIVMNLAVNARDAMPHGGVLRICTEAVTLTQLDVARNSAARPGKFVCLSVTDTGCGMSAEVMSHIFEPFFTTKDVGQGTGLGLATAYGIVAQHEGWIEVASEMGEGTTIDVFLPRQDASATSPAKTADPGAALRGGDETILLVEDEPEVREIASEILGFHGYRVLQAADGPEAIDIWRKRSSEVDLLVTDIVMPNGLKGNVLAERLRAERPELRVIFSSGYSADFATESSPLDPRTTFLQKPYKLEGLVKAVRDMLDHDAA